MRVSLGDEKSSAYCLMYIHESIYEPKYYTNFELQ